MEVTTNEENETVLLKLRAKLYRFDTSSDPSEWKVAFSCEFNLYENIIVAGERHRWDENLATQWKQLSTYSDAPRQDFQSLRQPLHNAVDGVETVLGERAGVLVHRRRGFRWWEAEKWMPGDQIQQRWQ